MWRPGWIALVFVVLAAGCTSEPPTGAPSTTSTAQETSTTEVTTTTTSIPPTTTTTEAGPPVGTLTEGPGTTSYLTVPLDHDDPDGPTIQVPVNVLPASDPGARVGALFVNPGGPGFPASGLVTSAEVIYSPEVLAAFDIVALDPRGSFDDLRVDCGSGLAEYLSGADFTPDTDAEVIDLVAHIEAHVDECDEANPGALEHISTMDTVHDLAFLVEALGEEQVSWFGFSYGTILGVAFATEYPELVRAAVFDGAYYPYGYDDPFAEALVETKAEEELLDRLVDGCDADSDCPIEGPAVDAFARVAAEADDDPFDDDPTLPPVNEIAFYFSIVAGGHAYGASATPLYSAVAAADAGDGVPLQRFFAATAEFQGSGGATLPINCMDYPNRGEPTLSPDDIPRLVAAAPTFYEVFPLPEGFEDVLVPGDCDVWPAGPDVMPTPLTAGGVPVLVVTATGDPVTPEGSAARLAADLTGETTLVVEDDQHVSYDRFGPPARRCAASAIDAFLIELERPSGRCEA